MKRRKITKESLDELAQNLPIISEDECKRYVGGASYYDLSGNFLGQIGYGDEIRVISRMEFDKAKQEYSSLGATELSIRESCNLAKRHLYGAPLSSAPHETIRKVVHRYLPDELRNRVHWISRDRDGVQAGFGGSGIFYLNYNAFIWDNESSIASTIDHELSHLERRDYIGATEENVRGRELAAYLDQINSPSYSNTTYEYRKHLADILISEHGYGQDEAYSIAKVYL